MKAGPTSIKKGNVTSGAGPGTPLSGQQLQADLTTIKSLAETLLSKIDNTSVGSASDPNQPGGAGTLGQFDQAYRPNLHLPKHDS